ncbi:TPA: hypothetical protein I0I20_RS02985 [Enterococcus faecium]
MIVTIFLMIFIVVLIMCIVSLSRDNEALNEKASIYKSQNDSLMKMLTKLTNQTIMGEEKKNV